MLQESELQGRKKKRIFLCARFLPHGEAGDVRNWAGRSSRLPLELVVARFFIAAATDSYALVVSVRISRVVADRQVLP
jgi:hypothetical protein